MKKHTYLILILALLFVVPACKKSSSDDPSPTPTPTPVDNSTVPILTTSNASSVNQTTSVNGGSISSDGGATVTARGICWSSTNTNPTITDSKSSNGSGTGSFSYTIKGLTPSSSVYVRAYATNKKGTAYGNAISFTTLPYGSATDIDGNVYRTINIGTQTWMVENLKTTKFNDGTSIPNVTSDASWSALTTPGYCFMSNDAATYKATYGALYNWYTVNTGKLAPAGWHVPTDADWMKILGYCGGFDYAGNILKEAGTTHWVSDGYYIYNVTNETGFTGLPAGYRQSSDGQFFNLGRNGMMWELEAYSSTQSSGWHLNYLAECLQTLISPKGSGFSVRCVKN